MAVIAQVRYRERAGDRSMLSQGSIIRYALEALLGKRGEAKVLAEIKLPLAQGDLWNPHRLDRLLHK